MKPRIVLTVNEDVYDLILAAAQYDGYSSASMWVIGKAVASARETLRQQADDQKTTGALSRAARPSTEGGVQRDENGVPTRAYTIRALQYHNKRIPNDEEIEDFRRSNTITGAG